METSLHAAAPSGGGDQIDLEPAPVAVVLEPSRAWMPISIREIWAFRELLYFLMWRDLKVRYKQTVIGVAWVIMQPLAMALVFIVFLGHFARIPSADIPYSLLVFSGLIPWLFFSSAISTSGNSLVGNSHLITKVYFPRLIVPLAAVGARLVDFAITFLVLVGLMFYYRVDLTWKILALPLFVVLLMALAFGVGTLTSALNVKYRDVSLMLPVIVQVWMFATPIVYPVEIVPQAWRQWYALNPLVGLIEGFRAVLLNREVNWTALGISAAITAVLVVGALYVFRRMERNFADLV